jgi:hypothetical protein
VFGYGNSIQQVLIFMIFLVIIGVMANISPENCDLSCLYCLVAKLVKLGCSLKLM